MNGSHMLTHFDHDEYNEIINGELTYDSVVDGMRKCGSVIIGWTDERATHLDIMFTTMPIQAGNLQRGMHFTDLFVSISGFGMFGFEANGNKVYPDYVGEKLGLGGVNATTEKLAELIGEVRERLAAAI